MARTKRPSYLKSEAAQGIINEDKLIMGTEFPGYDPDVFAPLGKRHFASDEGWKTWKDTFQEKVVKTSYLDTPEAREVLDSSGKIVGTETPGFKAGEHKPLRKGDFANEFEYLRHKADLCDKAAENALKQAKRLRSDADICEKQPDPEKRKRAQKAMKMKANYDALVAALAEEGIEFDENGDPIL